MTTISSKKLLRSKWTSVSPQHKEKHFMIIDVEYDDLGCVTLCIIQAVMTKREQAINWRDLKDSTHWKQGWH